MSYEPKGKIKYRFLVGRTYKNKIIVSREDASGVIYNEELRKSNVIPASIDVIHAYTNRDAKILYNIYNRRSFRSSKGHSAVKIGSKHFKI